MAEVRGFEGSFDESFDDLFRVAYRAAYRVTGDAEASEDAASEALIRAGVRWRRIADRALPWVVRVSTNLAIDHARKQARIVGRSEPVDGDPVDPLHTDVDLHRALASLPKRQREVVVLRYFGDLSEQQIADELAMAPGTVKSHASRGLATLRRLLTDPPSAASDDALQPEHEEMR